MTKIIKSDPFLDIVNVRDTMDRILDNYFGRSSVTFEGYGVVDLDLYQTDKDIVIETSIPGIDPEDINISVAGEVLTIKGEVKKPKKLTTILKNEGLAVSADPSLFLHGSLLKKQLQISKTVF